MSAELKLFPTVIPVEEALKFNFDVEDALGWGIQSMNRDTVRAMVLLASSRSDHYRYALAVSPDIALYLRELPPGSTTGSEYLVANPLGGSLIGQFDMIDLYELEVDNGESYMVLFILNDDRKAESYIITKLRAVEDHIVRQIIPERK